MCSQCHNTYSQIPLDSSGIIITSMRVSRILHVGFGGLATSLLLLGLAPASASSANISHSYHSDLAIPVGSIVSLDAKRSDYVTASNTSNARRILGVAVNSSDSLLAVDAKDGSVQVATSGSATVLVSDVNGAIKLGDQVAVSSFNGVGMEAASGSVVIGLAQSSFDGSAKTATVQTVTDVSGAKKQIHVGLVTINIAPGISTSTAADAKLSGLQKIVKGITGKIISTGRIVTALVITIVTLVTLLALIYAAVYSSIISIGRNPLAKYAIFRSLGGVIGMVGVIAFVSTVVIILLLQ